MKKIVWTLLLTLLPSQFFAQHSLFNELLSTYVSDKGVVDYMNFNGKKLRRYLNSLEKNSPDHSWSVNKQKAFWINTYNAYTIYLVLHARNSKELKNSILDIKRKGKSAWKIPFVKIGDHTYTLDQVEHEILRKNFKDPKIHVGVNCASKSCPKLSNKAFTEENIDRELEKLMIAFINDSTKNTITTKNIIISKIFNWFESDFTEKGSLIDFLNQYSNIPIDKNATIHYQNYDWTLNKK
ncbi:DUF547 domain-containing protein [Polaribacter sp. HL-MS24]|uniref:DUF547 domain-containing protein n=1 Tax=Polaribacter sp. HL-MS24 TaxID=3077735 RepID=UPI0029349C91|nr:DUF547 domain-containing protein [Polaribacter sp. HL-MS24]WOC40855.1 DUF547 domain-containing protein [Polaribacter sp. HL-MS24]